MIFNPIIKKNFANSVESENVTIDLDMKNGDQVITPSAGKLLDKATIKKPSTFLPENIKKDVTIAGVVGSYETPTETLAATANGEYAPPTGKHFSKVTVNVEATNGGTSEDLTAELTEQDELLTAIEEILEGDDTGGGSGGDSATFEVNFMMIDDESGDEIPRTTNGYYVMDDGEEVYFTNCASITISEGLYVSSRVGIFISCYDIAALYVTNADGCVYDEDASESDFIFKIESQNASATILEEYG